MHKLLAEPDGNPTLLFGNEAIARGALEAGVAFASTYPGTPSSEISANFFQISRQRDDFYFEYSTNEKVALEVAAAAANSGVRSMCVMKHVGVNVAADALMTLAYVGVTAGLVLLSADDPHMFSSQNEQDNRYYGKLSGLPVLEPSSVDEAKQMACYAFELSEKLNEPVILRTTTRINHSTGPVDLGELPPRNPRGSFTKDPFNYVTVPAVSRKLHTRLLERMTRARALADDSPYNFVEGRGELGVVCSGVSYLYVSDALDELTARDKIAVLRIGFSHPLPDDRITRFLKTVTRVLVVEEGEPYLEDAVKAAAGAAKICVDIAGKAEDLFSRESELNPRLVKQRLAEYFQLPFSPPAPLDRADLPEIPQRPPNLCPGCSHRATFYAIKQAVDMDQTIIPTDIGCYTLGFLPPVSMGDFLICMGSSVGTACGFSRATGQTVIGIIGDSTFFHSGIPALINGVFNNHDFTLVILDNGTTAMTGHQPHPGVDMAELNFSGFNPVSIEDLVKGMGVKHVSVIRPYNLKKSVAAIKEAVAFAGVSVVISREACVLKAKGLKKKTTRKFHVSDRCRNHRTCVNEFACPAFFIENDRVQINPDLCEGCAVCAQICPENAILPLKSSD
ncbi:MAG: indolepyruvate ferredoxin oxidoreductase subunit alpha [Desulfosudaceae bacterium]